MCHPGPRRREGVPNGNEDPLSGGDAAHWNAAEHRVEKITLEITLPQGFPAKYKDALVSAVSLCTVKKHLHQPPAFEIVAR